MPSEYEREIEEILRRMGDLTPRRTRMQRLGEVGVGAAKRQNLLGVGAVGGEEGIGHGAANDQHIGVQYPHLVSSCE